MPKKKKKKIRKLSVSKKLLKEFEADKDKGFEKIKVKRYVPAGVVSLSFQ